MTGIAVCRGGRIFVCAVISQLLSVYLQVKYNTTQNQIDEQSHYDLNCHCYDCYDSDC